MRPTLAMSFVILSFACVLPVGAEEKPRFPGQTERGFLLPNGWTLTPAGEQVVLSDLPLNIIPLADNRHALVATSGFNAHELSVVDLDAKQKGSTQTVRQSWFGLALAPGEDKLWWSGGGGAALHALALKDGQLARADAGDPTAAPAKDDSKKKNFRSGLALDTRRNRLYSLDVEAGTLIIVDLAGKAPERTVTLGGRPYDIAIARNGSRIYVTDWSGRRVLALDPQDLHVVAKISVGEHPNQIAQHPVDDRIFVACANTNDVAVIDTKRGLVTETISTARLFPKAPEGSTPDALAVSPDGERLFVANADNNCVAVIDIEEANRSQVLGFIPTGWYPTAVAVTPDGKNLLIGVGKGNQTQANPLTAAKTGQKWPNDKERIGNGHILISARPCRGHCRSCQSRIRRGWPSSPKRCIATAPIRTSC